MKEDDRRPSFEQFLEGVNRLQADEAFREVLLEIDAEGEEAATNRDIPDIAASRPSAMMMSEDAKFALGY